MQLIVLGMHRSGTSVLARLLNLMGAYFGPEGMSTGENQENPKGFWERRDVRSLNDSVLHAVGCDWNRVSKLDVTALPAEVVADFDKRASKLVLEIDAHRPWILKEPRLCLLLPLWRKWLEVPVCIHIYRNPVEVASSLHTRNGIPMEAGLALWERYVRSALDASAGLPQLVVSHRQLMEQPALATARLVQQLSALEVPGLRLPTERELSAFVRPDLYRERESREDLRAYAKVGQRRLFDALQHGRLPPGKSSMSVIDEAALARYEASLPPIKPPSEKAMPDIKEVALRGELALREQEIQFLRQISEKHEADVRQRDERLAAMDRERSLACESRQKLEEILGFREERLSAMDREASLVRESTQKLEATLSLRDEQLALMEHESAILKVSASSMQADLNERVKQLQHSEDQLHAAERKVAVATEEAVTLKARIQECAVQLAAFAHQADSTRETLEAVRGENVQLKAELQDRDRELRQVTAEGARLAEESRLTSMAMLALEKRVETRYQELAQLGQLLIAREQELATVRIELDEANCRFESQRQSAEDATRELELKIANITQSRTWKFMAPMRSLSRKLRGAAGRDDPLGREGNVLRKSELFDETWYLQTYPDVARSEFGPIEHFLRFGAAECRNPGPGFDTAAYLKNNPDVSNSGMNPLVHYLTHGKLEGRRPK